ncbi:hypothetical protein BS78_04G289300 [Paspalum vaginatum]|nr:hypothetical protein BS78_04G289300 [Paspalum vaginatum]
MRRCLSNNARMQSLGLRNLISIFATTTISPEKKKHKYKEDSGSEYNGEEGDNSEDDLSDDSLIPEADALQELESTPASCIAKDLQNIRKNTKTTTKRQHKMAPGGIRPSASKRVLAEQRPQDVQTNRVTRSKKNYAGKNVGLSTEVEGESVSQAEIPIHAVPEVNACSSGEVGHNFAAHTTEVDIAQRNECHNESNEATQIEPTMDMPMLSPPNLNENTQNEQTRDGINSEDLEADEEEWIRGDNRGRGLERMSQSKKGKLPLVIEVGRIRPSSPLLAAKFANECNIAVKNHVPIFPRWKDYKEEENRAIFKNFMGKVHDICQHNKVNRGLVQFHQTTGSRSYDIHIQTLEEKYKDEPPNALQLFKECHYSKRKQGFTLSVQSAIDEIERKIANPVEDGEEPIAITDAVSKVLLEKTKKNKFLVNVGIQKKPSTSIAMQRDIEAELVREKQGSDELRALVNAQRQQMDAMGKQLEESEAARAKYEQVMKEKQAETDALLRRLMSMIPHATG